MAGLDIQGISQLGANLASSLDLHAEACYNARRNGLPKLVSLVHSTSSTLQKLHDLSQQGPKVFTGVCINDVNALAATCDILYKGILILLVERSEYLERDNDIGHMTKDRVESLLSCLAKKTFSMARTWEWLDPRLKICQQELTQVKFELMLRLLVVSIAQYQLSTTMRSPGDWESESSIRRSAENVARRRLAYHKRFTERRERWTKKESPLPSPGNSVDGKGSSATLSSSTTATPPSLQVKAVIEKNPVGEKEVKSGPTTVSPETAETSPKGKEDDTASCSDKSSYIETRSQTLFQRLFSRSSPPDVWEWEDLEAYMVQMRYGNKLVVKLPLEEEDIRSALRKLTTKRFWKRRPGLMDQYTSLDRMVREEVDKAISIAKQKSSREMTLVAISTRKLDTRTKTGNGIDCTPELAITLFFRLGVSLAPIRIIDLHHHRTWTLPYTSCQTVKMIKGSMPKLGAFFCCSKFQEFIRGQYDIYTDNNVNVTPETWDSVRRPGMTLRLRCFADPSTRLGPPLPWPNVVRPVLPSFTTNQTSHKGVVMKEIYQEMNDLFKLSRSWTPDKATMKDPGLGYFLRLWTNAIDPEAEDKSDEQSSLFDWSESSETEWVD